MTSEEKAKQIGEIAESAKAERIELIEVGAKTVMAEYFVVCSGNSDVHLRAIADRVSEKMREAKSKPRSVEGAATGWILMDFGDVVLHVMKEDQRQYYDLESLWAAAPKRDLGEVDDATA